MFVDVVHPIGPFTCLVSIPKLIDSFESDIHMEPPRLKSSLVADAPVLIIAPR